MAKATPCTLQKRRIDITEALELRDAAQQRHEETPTFKCSQCGRPVRPHKASQYGEAHFEHKNRNPNCSLSDPTR